MFLVACYAILHPTLSVGWSVGRLVGWLVGRSVGWSPFYFFRIFKLLHQDQWDRLISPCDGFHYIYCTYRTSSSRLLGSFKKSAMMDSTVSIVLTGHLHQDYWDCLTSDAGSQYRCGWVGRGIQPPSTPQPTHNTHTQKVSKTLIFPLFDSITMMDGPKDQWTDGRTKPLIELRVRN